MKRTTFIAPLVALTVALLIVSMVAAQSGSGYDLSWNTIADGGGTSGSGGYSLNGTIGRADAGTLTGGDYMLNGGFWLSAGSQFKVFLPLIFRP